MQIFAGRTFGKIDICFIFESVPFHVRGNLWTREWTLDDGLMGFLCSKILS